MEENDYRITDNISHPIDIQEKSVEEKYRLNLCFYSYQPPENGIDIAPTTTSSNIVFASFNNIRKITDETIRLWAKVLLAIHKSILLIKVGLLNNEEETDSKRYSNLTLALPSHSSTGLVTQDVVMFDRHE